MVNNCNPAQTIAGRHRPDATNRREIAVRETERRRYSRVALNIPGVIQFSKGPEETTQITEISEGGLKCIYHQSVSLGVSAELRFVLPVAAGKACVVAGRVQHHHRDDDYYQLGIEFTRVSADVIGVIREFVRQRMMPLGPEN